MQKEIPVLPQGQKAAESVCCLRKNWYEAREKTTENPELYAVFPYKLYGVGKEAIQQILDTFHSTDIQENGGWRLDAIQAAYLGLAEEAKRMTVQSFTQWCKECRFPGFWGPNFDWVPDKDHGSETSIALQAMLLQVDGDKMMLLLAWPKERDVECRMHGSCNTSFRLKLKNGIVEELDIVLADHRKNVTVANLYVV